MSSSVRSASCGRPSARNATETSGDKGPLPPGASLETGAEAIDLEEASVLKREAPVRAAKAPPAIKGEVEASPDQVKALLGEQPGLLETGLGLHANEDGDPVGIDFAR